MDSRLVVNLSKPAGEREELVPLTAAEQAARDAARGEADAAAAAATAATGNERTLRDRVAAAIDALGADHAAWDTLSPAQKDRATRNAIRLVLQLSRLVIRKLDSPGP